MKKTLWVFLLTFVLLNLSGTFKCVNAQEKSMIKDSIFSDALQEKRLINILLPESYQPGSDDKYEVIYLTDGEWVEELFPFIYKFAQDEDYVPPVIIVSVPNLYIDGANQRDRDFLPVHVSQPPISGGADKFLTFLEKELIPYIDGKFPTNGTNSLYGHSYGGVFVMYALLTKPDLFNTYYSTDPAFWWNDDYLIKLAEKKISSLTSDKLLWIAGITETYKGMGSGKMDSVLKQKAPENLRWKFVTFPNEKHNSVRLKAMYDGIKFSYSGYTTSSFTFHPMNGILMPDSSTFISFQSFPEVRYTTDGSEPTLKSKKADSELRITAPSELVLKSFSASGKYDLIAKGNFEIGNVLPSVKLPRKANPGGLKYSFFEGNFNELPDFKVIKPAKTGIADSTFNMNEAINPGSACLFEGYFKAERKGHYLLAVESTNKVKFYINGKLIFENDGNNPVDNLKSYVLPLEQGYYPVRIEYLNKNEGNLNLIYVEPGTTNGKIIPLNLLYGLY